MRVLSVSIHYLAGAADKGARQILLSASVDSATTYRQVYAELSVDWEEESQNLTNSQTTDAEIDALFEKGLTVLKRRDAALLDTPFHKSMKPGWERSKIAFFSVTWTTNEDDWETPPS